MEKVIAAGIISLSFLYLQGGTWSDAITTIIAGAIGFLIVEYMQSKSLTMFIPEFVGSFILGTIVIFGSELFQVNKSFQMIVMWNFPTHPQLKAIQIVMKQSRKRFHFSK
ncbi:uncharacterized membrane protein YjjP (DUF1212 family) [Staphylococcus cohnii]